MLLLMILWNSVFRWWQIDRETAEPSYRKGLQLPFFIIYIGKNLILPIQ